PRYRENVKTSDGPDRMASIGSPAVHACTSLGLAVQIVSGERKNTFSLQGIVGSMSRMPTFRRKFKNLVKVLYLEALQAGIIATPPEGGGLKRRLSGQGSIEKAGVKHLTVNKEEKLNDAQVPEDVV
nr:uncharacterized membrane protein At3g27390 isoform X1 [Tanacetum cinerariifolium]